MREAEPKVIVVVGAFSGAQPADPPRLREVDRDGFDALMRKLTPRADLGLPFCRSLPLTSWEDFHPDALCDRLPILDKLVDARRAVADPVTMRALLEEAGVDLAAVPTAAPAGPDNALDVADGVALLDDMIGGGATAPAVSPRGSGDPTLDRVLAEIIAATADTRDPEREQRWSAAIDAELGARVRAILWHPAFRRLEASWGSLRALVRDPLAGPGVRFAVLDHPLETLAGELEAGRGPTDLTLGRILGEPSPFADRIDLVVTDYHFDADEADVLVLDALAQLGSAFRVPILAAASGRTTRVEEASEAELSRWTEHRARWGWLGLCAPRLLLRVPYGPDSEPVERFDFDEATRGDASECHAWGSSAFALARAFVAACATEGSPESIERHLELGGLPLHVYREDGEVRALGPSEELLTERRREAYELTGIIPVTGIRGEDAVRITSLRSAAGIPLPLG